MAASGSLAEPLQAALLVAARDAFTSGMHVVAGVSAVVLLSVAGVTLIMLRDVRPLGVSKAAPAPVDDAPLALDDQRPVGFVSGVEITHPDKGTEMFLYELGVDEPYRRRGIGRGLVRALRVGVDSDENVAAPATYRSAGADAPEAAFLFTWTFSA